MFIAKETEWIGSGIKMQQKPVMRTTESVQGMKPKQLATETNEINTKRHKKSHWLI